MESLIRACSRRLRRYLTRLVGSTAADDVLQETLISVARKTDVLSEPPAASRMGLPHSKPGCDRLSAEAKTQGGLDTDDETAAGGSRRPAEPIAPDVLRELLDSPLLSPGSRRCCCCTFKKRCRWLKVAPCSNPR